MGKFNDWLNENFIYLSAYDKNEGNKKVFTARAKNDDEVKTHLAALHQHVQRTGHIHHVMVHNKKTFETQTHTIKPHNPTGHPKYNS